MYPRVLVCARDSHSASIPEQIMPGRVILAPDIAFFIDVKTLGRRKSRASGRTLLALRHDKAAPSGLDLNTLPIDTEYADWPQLSDPEDPFNIEYRRKLRLPYRFHHFHWIERCASVRDHYYIKHQRPVTLRLAVRWLDQFDTVYSTRLHIALLAILLGKDVHILDNSYQKVTHLIDTWFPGVRVASNNADPSAY